ncbi:MAG TPA: ROK family transcriptional regulator [Candidatus Dormibacteraeota bacterium]|nr:ROK family transcriptional regulator [Candidatus Dormibacteraeota bacterium]
MLTRALTPDQVGQRSETVRRANLSAIARELHGRGSLSRSELVARTGLTRSAIRGLIGEFVVADLVTEERSAPDGAPGRPSPLVRPRPEAAVALALEVSVDSLAAAVVGLGGDALGHVRVDRPRGHFAVDEIVADLASLAHELLTPRHREALVGVGVGVVGVVRRSDGSVSTAPNLGWRDVPLGAKVAVALDLDVPVHVANEADLGALVEFRRGEGRGADDVLFIQGEVGVGGGIIVAGRPLTGAAGFAGEIGHIPVNPDGAPCQCGSVGCWETEIGERALLALGGRPPDGGRDAVDAIIGDAAAGDPRALEALDAVGRSLGHGLAGLINILNPRVVVLGGLFSRIHPFIAERLEAQLDRFALAAPRSLVRIAPAALGVDAPLLGAAELAFEPFLADPAAWLGPRELLAVAASA